MKLHVIKARIGLFFLFVLFAEVLAAQTADPVRTPQQRPQGDSSRTFRSPAGVRNMPLFREGSSSGPMVMFRQFMREELKNVPALDPVITDLVEIQQQRNLLQRQRSQIADDRTLSSDESLRKFHDLLKREDELNVRQREVLQKLLHDGPVIQKQIADRKKYIQKRLQELAPSGQPPVSVGTPGEEQTEFHNLSHAARLYEFLGSRMTSIQANPDRIELLNRFFKGMPNMDETSPDTLQHARERLQQIQQEQDELADRMDQLEDELRQLRQLLRVPGSAGSGSAQRWRKGRDAENPIPPEFDQVTSGLPPLQEPPPVPPPPPR